MGLWQDLKEFEPRALIVVGFVLFIIPEPATSTLGAGLMLFGLAWWFAGWRDEEEPE